jgi:hypothetical protein
MTPDRAHDYLFTVEIRIRHPATATDPAYQTWEERQIEACAMWEAAHKLKQKPDDVRFVTKRVL